MNFRKYKVKGKIFSLFGEYRISDQSDALCYSAKSNFLRTSMSIRDEFGQEVLMIRRKFLSLRYTFFIEKDDKPIFKVWKTLSFKPQVYIESLIEPDAFEIQGNIWATEYAFYREGLEFAYVSHKIWDIRGVYGLAIKEEEDHSLVIALVLIIDMIKKANRRRRSG